MPSRFRLRSNLLAPLTRFSDTASGAVLANLEVKERPAKLGLQAAPGTPEDLAARLRADLARWTKVVREAHIKPE